jgi:outer membrane lipoprotein-sorting protein
VSQWLSAQTNLHTWSAEVTQIRTLKSLAQPLEAQGRVWFAAPNLFRWEIQKPSRTIAVRQAERMVVIYPGLKRVEQYDLTGKEAGRWKEMLALMDAGFPRDLDSLEARFKIRSQSVVGDQGEVILQPRSSAARRLMSTVKIVIATNDFTLRSTELRFADGSTMRNNFSQSRMNPSLEPDLFNPTWATNFTVVKPLNN